MTDHDLAAPFALGDVVTCANPWRLDSITALTGGRLLRTPPVMKSPSLLVVIDLASSTCKCRHIVSGETWWFGYDELQKAPTP